MQRMIMLKLEQSLFGQARRRFTQAATEAPNSVKISKPASVAHTRDVWAALAIGGFFGSLWTYMYCDPQKTQELEFKNIMKDREIADLRSDVRDRDSSITRLRTKLREAQDEHREVQLQIDELHTRSIQGPKR